MKTFLALVFACVSALAQPYAPYLTSILRFEYDGVNVHEWFVMPPADTNALAIQVWAPSTNVIAPGLTNSGVGPNWKNAAGAFYLDGSGNLSIDPGELGIVPADISGFNTAVASVAPVRSVNGQTGDVSLSIPAAQVNSDWNSGSGVSQILNKPNLSIYATNSQVQTALATKEPVITAGTTGQYYRGDKTWAAMPSIPSVKEMRVLERVQTDGSGNYTWTFSPAFSSAPAVSVTSEGSSTVQSSVQIVGAPTSSNVVFKVFTLPTQTLLGINVGVPTATQAYIHAIAVDN